MYSQDSLPSRESKKRSIILYTNALSAIYEDMGFNLSTASLPLCGGVKMMLKNNKFIIGLLTGPIIKAGNAAENITGFYANIEFQIMSRNKTDRYYTIGVSGKYSNTLYLYQEYNKPDIYAIDIGRVKGNFYITLNKLVLVRRMYFEIGFGPSLYYLNYLNTYLPFPYMDFENRNTIGAGLRVVLNIGYKI